MGKIILTLDGMVLREIPLLKRQITIGRHITNDIVIDDLEISAEHVKIVTDHGDALLEDRNSTNGTQVNGQPVKKHFLQDGDVIDLARYQLRYIARSQQASGIENTAALIDMNVRIVPSLEITRDSIEENCRNHMPAIKILNGANAGREISLNKPLTTIGRSGLQVAVIASREDEYSISHVEGAEYPLVNGVPIGVGQHQIINDDLIDLSGIQMMFLVKNK